MGERAFVAVWPPATVVRRLETLPRPAEPGIRWVPAEQWHVTLRFLGAVELADVAAALDRLDLAATPPPRVHLGPAVSRLGASVLCVPAKGLDRLAAAVTSATGALGAPPDPRPFAGHLTLGRLRGRGSCGLAGHRVDLDFVADAVELVASRRVSGRIRYDRVGRWPLGGDA